MERILKLSPVLLFLLWPSRTATSLDVEVDTRPAIEYIVQDSLSQLIERADTKTENLAENIQEVKKITKKKKHDNYRKPYIRRQVIIKNPDSVYVWFRMPDGYVIRQGVPLNDQGSAIVEVPVKTDTIIKEVKREWFWKKWIKKDKDEEDK